MFKHSDPCNLKVKVDVSHHTFNETMGDWVNSKQLVFVMDEFVAPDSGKKGKEKKSKKNLTFKNFGSALSVSAMKSSKSVCIAWRCRLVRHR